MIETDGKESGDDEEEGSMGEDGEDGDRAEGGDGRNTRLKLTAQNAIGEEDVTRGRELCYSR